ncbi:hypothetical protein NH8B_1954 [Pseudogulbenkiania sp. NH8B]|uniref:hypothetical protein n=1 Tax=Pseudogulbenkiania sp. (strain NH8B) TaxID=748280 RepID=UPI00022798B9|nr:hypothetical protein [Pseudogulbenkiania sp. NH8B]BAK76769.1 hypothetical protein NH8B_1954 [Pseudogulbenkiania sp. NH8B]
MTPHTLTLLGPGHYRAPLRPVDGTASHCHEITLKDETGRHRNAYLKAWPGGSKGLANEAAGWLISRARGIDTPPRAWIILMRVGDLEPLFDMEWNCAPDKLWPCWATESIEGVPLDRMDAGMWAERLACWPRLPDAIAVHEWLHHTDANAGNIIAVDLDQFTIVDHADILGGERWSRGH